MNRRVPALVFLALVLPVTSRAAGLFDVDVTKVVDGVYVAARREPLRPYVEGNVTIIINESDVVVVDAGGSSRIARNVIAAIRRLTPNPVRYLIFTHIHRDHRFGAQEYVKAFPGLEIIAHPIVRDIVAKSGDEFVNTTIARMEKAQAETREDIARLEREHQPKKLIDFLRRYAEEDAPAAMDEYRSVRNLAPTATVADTLTIRRAARTIEVRFLGRGDTDHDLIVFLPQDHVVCAGDMVVHPFPYGFSSHPVEWRETLQKLNALPYRHLIPGHGAVQHDKTYVSAIVDMLGDLHRQVKALAESGAEEKALLALLDMERYETAMAGKDPIRRHFFREWFLEPTAKAAYASFRAAR